MGTEKFCLRWNDFEHNISSAFRELRDDKDFFDVTLACEDEQIQAHKVILSACSPFFRNVLRRNPHQHPLLYLKGVNYSDLQSVLNFMYHGEVNVAQEELNSFLSVAEDLKVKGLTQNQPEGQSRKGTGNVTSTSRLAPDLKPPTPSVASRSFTQPQKKSQVPSHIPNPATSYTSHTMEEDDIQEIVPVKSEPREPAPLPPQPMAPIAPSVQPMYTSQEESHSLTTADDTLVYDDTYDDYGQYAEDQGDMTGHQMTMGGADNTSGSNFQDPSELLEFVKKDPSDQKYYCTLCVATPYSHKASYNTRNHVESQHFPNIFSYPCDQCDMVFSTKNKFHLHRSRIHKNVKNQSFY